MCLLLQCLIEGAKVEYFNWTFSSDPMNCEDLSNVTMTKSHGNGSESAILPGNVLRPKTPHLSLGMKLLIAGMNGVVN